MLRRTIAGFILTAAFLAAAGRTVTVGDLAQLEAAIFAAKPGDEIVMRDGRWKNARITLSAAGTDKAPVTLRAQTPGRVILTGESSLTFAAPYVNAEGLLFQEGAIAKGSVVTFRADHGRLTESAIVSYNPAELATAYYWVYFEGSDNQVERSFFSRKNHLGPLVGNAIKGARRNSVVRCHFHDIGSSNGKNGMEIFRVWGYGGNEELGDDGAFFTIESNLFEHADGEGQEIISLKSNRNRVINNTVWATLGGITNRSGNFNTIEGNVILCQGRKGAYGMRITGQHQRVSNNYIARCDYGIGLMAGEFIDRDLTGSYSPVTREGTPLGRVPRYNWPRETEISRNTFFDNAGADLTIGSSYKSGWPQSQRILIPEDNLIAENRIVKLSDETAIDGAEQDSFPPLDTFHFAPNRFTANIVAGGTVRLMPMPKGIALRNPATMADNAVPPTLKPDDVGPAWIQIPRKAGDPRFK